MGEIARLIGQPLLPWQQLVADVALEVDPSSGRLAYREIVVTVMRQSGKTTLLLCLELDRCLAWPERQHVAYTAQTGLDARKKLLEDQIPVLEASPLWGSVSKVRRAQGHEGLDFVTGSRIDVVASGESAGHGSTVDLAVADEAFNDVDDRREQALLPAMATRPDAQFATFSTQGSDRSLFLSHKTEMGRLAAEADSGGGVAYFEWSVPLDADVDDPEVWWESMPALGWTILPPAVVHARQTMRDAEFRRAFCNQRTESSDYWAVFGRDVWAAVCSSDVAPSGELTFAVDVAPDRSAAAIAVSGGGVLECVESREGSFWVVERCGELWERWRRPFVFDGGGPVGSFVADLERAGVGVDPMSNGEVIEACGWLFGAVADGTLRVREHAAFDRSVRGLAKRKIGDRFVWDRSASEDATPIVAATLAGARERRVEPVRVPFVMFGS